MIAFFHQNNIFKSQELLYQHISTFRTSFDVTTRNCSHNLSEKIKRVNVNNNNFTKNSIKLMRTKERKK